MPEPGDASADPMDDLIEEHLVGRLGAPGVARLEAWLKADRANRERYVRAARFAADVRQLAHDRQSRKSAGVPSERIVRPRLRRRQRVSWTPWLVAASLMLALAGWVLWPVAAERPANGVATLVAGTVRIDGRELGGTAAIAERARLTVLRAATLRWSDGSEVDLALGSRATVVGDGVSLDDGVASASVAKRDPAAPFIIDSVQARVVVMGTRFRVVADQSSTAVAVSEGVVQVRDRVGGEVLVQAGQSITARVTGIEPRTLSVAPQGEVAEGAYATLQAAIDAARPGDTVRLLPGRHSKAASIQQVVEVRTSGRPDAPLVIRGHPQAEIHSAVWNGVRLKGVSWVRLEDLTLLQSTESTIAGNGISLVEGCRHIVISNCTIKDFGADGIAINDSAFVEITGTTIDATGGMADWGAGGISIGGAPKVVAAGRGPLFAITGNRITNVRTTKKNRHGDGWTGGNAIAINGNDAQPVGSSTQRIRIAGNVLAGSDGAAIMANRVGGLDVEDNTCHRNGRRPEHLGSEVILNGRDCRLVRNLLVPSTGRRAVSSGANALVERQENRVWGGSDVQPAERLAEAPFATLVADENERRDFALRPGLGAGAPH